jgi:phosphoribosylamine--glycine ligase
MRMRFLGIGDFCDLSALYIRLLAEGHEVKVYIANPLCHDTLAGLVSHVWDWEAELEWIKEFGDRGIILFENAAEHRGRLQDELRAKGFHVIGGSEFGDKLENDRAFAMGVLKTHGFSTCPVHEFKTRHHAVDFLETNPGRYVLKYNGPRESFVGSSDDGRDVRAYLKGLCPSSDEDETFILMQHLKGIETGVGAYFDGERFIMPACLDWEHKRFFPGDLGENTGEMGTVVTYQRTQRFFDVTLGRLEGVLRTSGYCGYINLNTIVNEEGIWPLEFTCRFGYPGYAILDPLQVTPWGELFHSLVRRSNDEFVTRSGFSVGIVMTTPPFPYSRRDVSEPIGLPISFDAGLSEADRLNIHFGEVGLEADQLVTSGSYGWTLVVTGTGATIEIAKSKADRLVARVTIPNARYRTDIGKRLIEGQFARLDRLGVFDQ